MSRNKRDPLPAGDPRRLTDARCAWRKMSREQREVFVRWLLPREVTGVPSGLRPRRLHDTIVEATLTEWDGIHPAEPSA